MEQITLNREDLKTLLVISERRRLLLIDAVQLVYSIMGPDPDKWPSTKAGMIMRATKLIREAEELETKLKKFNAEYISEAIELTKPDEELIKKLLQC